MKISITLLLCLIIGTACSQPTTNDFQAIYDQLCDQDDDSKTIVHPDKWEETIPNDPEMFIAGFNFYLQKSKEEVLRMDGGPAQGQSLQIMDSSNNEPVGYIYGDVSYNDELFAKSIDYLTRGIEKNPSRQVG